MRPAVSLALAAATLAGCLAPGSAGQVVPGGPGHAQEVLPGSLRSAGVGPASRGIARSATLDVAVSLRRVSPPPRYGLQYLTTDVATLAVGLFDRGEAVPVFGFFYPGATAPTADNPLSDTAFAALAGAIGSDVAVGKADRADLRRYLFRTQAEPGSAPAAVRFARFPNLAGGALARGYNLFAAAFDAAGALIGFHELDLADSDLVSGSVAFDLTLDFGVGQAQVVATAAGSTEHPLSGLTWLLVGIFDSGDTPRLGYVQDGTGNTALAASRGWFSPLAAFLSNQGLPDTGESARYCIRAFQAPIAGGATSVTFRNLPPGSSYRPFILALEGAADVGHLLSSASLVASNATVSVDLGAFTTDGMAGPGPASTPTPAPGGSGAPGGPGGP